jgi:hypothetical protein
VGGAEVNLIGPGSSWRVVWAAREENLGGFRLGGVLPGAYHLVVSTGDGRWGTADIVVAADEESDELEIRVSEGARLQVRYPGTGQRAQLVVELGGRIVMQTGVDAGTDSWLSVPAGKLRGTMTVPGVGTETWNWRLGPGEQAEATFSKR